MCLHWLSKAVKGYKWWNMDLGGSTFIIMVDVYFDMTHMRVKFKYLKVNE